MAAPGAVVSAVLAIQFRASLADCLPVESDAIHYWNEITCFTRAGFWSGYCVDDDEPARARWTRFGPHGPGFPVVYGLPALIFGWHETSGPLFNVAFLAIASGVWVWLARPSNQALLAATALVATFWPLILYLPITMQESLHCAIALVLAGLATRTFDAPPRCRVAFAAAVIVASLIKLSWILVLIPLALANLPGLRRRNKLLLLAATAAATVAAIWVFTRICSPYPDRLMPEIGRARLDPTFYFWTMELRWERAWADFLRPSSAPPLGLLQRYEILAIALLGAGLMIARKHARVGTFAAGNVMIVLIPTMLIFFMTEFRDYRMMAPPVLLSLLLLLRADWRLAVPFIVANMACVGFLPAQFAEFHGPRLNADRHEIAQVRAELAPLMPFRPGPDGWSNTLLFPVRQKDQRLLGLPPGIGLTFALEENPEVFANPRSHYVILPPAIRFTPAMHLRFKANTSLGPLYMKVDEPDDSASP